MTHTGQPLKKILELTKTYWDQPAQRDAVRDNFHKVCKCRTAALGGEVYASAAGEKVFYHTCKSKCLPKLRKSRDSAMAERAVGYASRYTVCWHRPHHARCLLAGLQGQSPSSARSTCPGRCGNSAVGVEPIRGTPISDRHTAHFRRASQPSPPPPHNGFYRGAETRSSKLGAITQV